MERKKRSEREQRYQEGSREMAEKMKDKYDVHKDFTLTLERQMLKLRLVEVKETDIKVLLPPQKMINGFSLLSLSPPSS